MYVEFMKNYILADSGEQMPVRLISAPEPKTFCSYFRDMMYFEFMKNFLIADSGEQTPLRLITAFWAQKRLFLLSRHDVRRVHEKFSYRRFRWADAS